MQGRILIFDFSMGIQIKVIQYSLPPYSTHRCPSLSLIGESPQRKYSERNVFLIFFTVDSIPLCQHNGENRTDEG